MAPPPPLPSRTNLVQKPSCDVLGRIADSVVNHTKEAIAASYAPDNGTVACQLANPLALVYGDIASRFDNLMTSIDNERLRGDENSFFCCKPETAIAVKPTQDLAPTTDRALIGKPSKKPTEKKPKNSGTNVAASVVSGTYFSKVELYANSKLPMNLPRLALYLPTWPLLSLAAQYSSRVYEQPTGSERDTHVEADWRNRTKAMVIKSVPMDDMNTIVFAIRGTASFTDWTVNLHTEPASPAGFLDDPGNLCHRGFLSVARSMIKPVASRLRHMLAEQPRRSTYSLLITGHSAGGAVAALLYSHMMGSDPSTQSELRLLTTCFKRVHCITFGAPPVSLLPILKPDRPELRKSVFLSIVNEGDPVVRADKAYVRSLLELLSAPPPSTAAPKPKKKSSSSSSSSQLKKSKSKHDLVAGKPVWNVPPCTLSNAGRIVVLRSGDARAKPQDRKTVRERLDEGVVAVTCYEDQLRPMIWGDPVCHLMSLYAGRIEILAVGAVTGQSR
ncbi:Alpha/Beta hydrolase protein [Stachybotrys elegans]|uniref:Alpha/Beta hydrolase protein n=1 Tax=Stachybotrys elegans TaxID=80388 RepID=A0A8K0SJ57_9HYPO|nr:Alpha/Beta hydrolase protein [Stachybotrys elegans]